MTNKADRTNKANTTQEHAYEDEKRGVSDRLKATLWHFLRLQRANSKEKARGLGLIWGLSGCRH